MILSHTHALWSDGLDPSSYRGYIGALMASDWARQGERNYRFLVLVDEDTGRIVASMKLYRFTARLDDRLLSAGGIGAVFTLPEARRKGLAARMLSMAHSIMAERGDALSILHSEIGAPYYARLGYRELAAHAVRIRVPACGGAASAVRPMLRDQLGAVIRIRDKEDAAAAFALVRDRAYWEYLLARASYPTVHLGRERWEEPLMLTPDGSGYLWAHLGRDHLGARARLLEFGENEPGSALPALLDDLFEECHRRGINEIEAWLGPAQAAREVRLAGALVTRVGPPRVVPMWFPLNEKAAADLARHGAAVALHLTDVF